MKRLNQTGKEILEDLLKSYTKYDLNDGGDYTELVLALEESNHYELSAFETISGTPYVIELPDRGFDEDSAPRGWDQISA